MIKKRIQATLILLSIAVGSFSFIDGIQAEEFLPAFPGAEGYGAKAVGGRGGQVIEVTSLNDSGPGSLRDAVGASGQRIIVFKVSGNIRLLSTLSIRNPYITIAAQTAPGGGITLYGYGLRVQTHDVIIRGLRFRAGDITGDADPYNIDSLHILGSGNPVYNVIIDHSSISWGIDKNIGVWGNQDQLGVALHDITIQWSISSEALNSSFHPKGNTHSMGMLLSSVANVSIHHNLIVHNNARNPKFSKGTTGESINNVIYDWGNYPTVIQDAMVNIIGNYFIEGPSHTNSKKGIDVWSGGPIYVEGNIGPQRPTNNGDEWNAVDGDRLAQSLSYVVPPSGIRTQTAFEAYELVLDHAGAPMRDAVDARIVQQVRDRGGSLISSQDDVGGWPDLAQTTPPEDNDHDGMPDTWETARGLNPNNPSDGNDDRDGDGYTNVEEYINSLIPSVYDPTQTFSDVPVDHWAYDEIEALYQGGYVSGCSIRPLMYCPDDAMTRAESAVFVERGLYGADYLPPDPLQTVFADVPFSEWYAKWADGLWNDGYTAGCGVDPLVFCPLQGNTRTEGTVFFLRMLNGANFTPPDPTGIFSDVSLNFWGAKWLEAAYNAGIIPACGTTPDLRICPDDALDRATAAYMMVQAKGLPIN